MEETKTTGDGTTNQSSSSTQGGGAAAAALAQRQQRQQSDEPVEYTAVGKEFTDWFNDKLTALLKPTITLGTKQAEVIRLGEDGRLECEVAGTGSQNEQTFVAFNMSHFEQLIRKITALGL